MTLNDLQMTSNYLEGPQMTFHSGVLIYEMCQGHGPFFAEDTVEIYERIRESHVYLPNTFTKNLKTLLVGEANDDLKKGLLVADVTL